MCLRSGFFDFCTDALFRSSCKPLLCTTLQFALRRIFYFRVQKSLLLHVALRAPVGNLRSKAAIGRAKVGDLTSYLGD